MKANISKSGICVLCILCFVVLFLLITLLTEHKEQQNSIQAQKDVLSTEAESFEESEPSRAAQESGTAAQQFSPAPVKLPVDAGSIRSSRGVGIEYWRAFSERSSRDVARDLLLDLQSGENKLVRADFLDLSGESWGCTVLTPEEESLVISLIPERLGSPRNENNRLAITVVRIAKPELEQSREKE
jgi:hypothetical protein